MFELNPNLKIKEEILLGSKIFIIDNFYKNPDEIYDQVVLISRQAKEFFNRPLTNIVFMGMGEPLMNYNNVLKSIDKITSKSGLGMSPRRIVVSTSGVPKMIKKMADDNVKFKLAVSLHSAINETRTSIMPFNEKMNLDELADSLQYWLSLIHI